MAARVRASDKRPIERLRERIVTGDRGWFFAASRRRLRAAASR